METNDNRRLICNGPNELELASSLMSNTEVFFWILAGEVTETNSPDRMRCIVQGIEKGDEPKDYHLAVSVLNLKTPQWQHFKYSTLTLCGEWVGCLDIGHKAYKGHSFSLREAEQRNAHV